MTKIEFLQWKLHFFLKQFNFFNEKKNAIFARESLKLFRLEKSLFSSVQFKRERTAPSSRSQVDFFEVEATKLLKMKTLFDFFILMFQVSAEKSSQDIRMHTDQIYKQKHNIQVAQSLFLKYFFLHKLMA